MHFSVQAQKTKKIPLKKFLIFQEMELSRSNFKNFLYFLVFQERKLRKKFLIFQEMKTLKKLLIFKKWNFSVCLGNIFNIFSKKSFSYILGNKNPEKICYISGNGTFLYFRKQNFLTFRERELPYISGSNFPSSNSVKSRSEKVYFILRKWTFLAPSL